MYLYIFAEVTTSIPPTITTATPTTTDGGICGGLTGTGFNKNGFRYDYNPTLMSWDNARAYCQSRGGDLAHHGMDSLTTRR